MLNSKLLSLALGGLFCVAASAGPLDWFNINGGAAGLVTVGPSTIDWHPIGTGFGDLAVTGTGPGIFTGLAGNGDIHDLNAAAQPVGTPFTLVDFLIMDNLPLWDWTATNLYAGLYPSGACGLAAAPGQVCTPFASSPFNLVNTAGGGSTAAFVLSGLATNGVGGLYSFVANFTTQFNVPFQNVLATLPVESSWSGTISVDQVPEPATFFLMSAGLVGVGLIRRVLR